MHIRVVTLTYKAIAQIRTSLIKQVVCRIFKSNKYIHTTNAPSPKG
jgi:hypothetical protein